MIKLPLAISLFLFASTIVHTAAELTPPKSPSLTYRDKTGENVIVQGQEYVVGKTRLYYFEPNGEKRYITSLNRISVETNQLDLSPFAILPDSYNITRRPIATPSVAGSSLSLTKINFSSVLPKAIPEGTEKTDIFAFVWIRDQIVTPLYISRIFNELTTSSLPDLATDAPQQSYQGYPALLVFRNGQALLPADRNVTRHGFDNTQDLDNKLLTAAANDFTPFLAENLPPKTKQNATLYDSILTAALQNGRTNAVKIVLNQIAKAEKTDHRKIPEYDIRHTLSNGHLDTLLTLLNHPQIELDKNKDNEILERAISDGYFDIADALLEHGYKLDPAKERLPDLLKKCLFYNRIDYVEKLYPRSKPKKVDFHTPFTTSIYHQIASRATPETLQYIKQFNIPIDLEDREKFTPLIKAAGYGNIPAVCWFIDNGARIDHRNDSGHTALQYSIVKQQAEATSCLLQQGSDINLIGPEGVTPLMQAVLFRDLAAARSIAQAGGIWNLEAPFLDHCLSYALQQDLAPILQIAIEQGLSPKYYLYSKWPLDWLSAYYQSPACQNLLDPDNLLQLKLQPLPDTQIAFKRFDRRDYQQIAKHRELPEIVTFTCLIDSSGAVSLLVLSTPIERFLENDLRKFISHSTFTPPHTSAGTQSYRLTAELKFPHASDLLPENLTTLSINKISLPEHTQ